MCFAQSVLPEMIINLCVYYKYILAIGHTEMCKDFVHIRISFSYQIYLPGI